MIYPENIGKYLSIYETALSNGELYTVITNKKAKGKKGSLVVLLKGTKLEGIISKLLSINSKTRNKVKEITLDMAPTMINICSKIFPSATQVTDRFHVQKLVNEGVQEIRIKYRWAALNDENLALEEARKNNKRYSPHTLENGDTIKQLKNMIPKYFQSS